MSIASEITRISTNISNAYTACRNKGAVMPQPQNSANLADTIAEIPHRIDRLTASDVNFYDYEGTLLYTFTAAEAALLTALPALPTHAGLSAQAWTHTLAQIQSASTVGQKLDVGAVYTTDDGSTRLYLFVAKGTRIPNLQIWVNMLANTSATVDWGDGTTGTITNTASSTAVVYAEKNDFAEVADDTILCVRIIGGSFYIGRESNYTVFGNPISDVENTPILLAAHLGDNCIGIVSSAFCICDTLKTVVISQSVRYIFSNAFCACYSLKAVVIPQSSISEYVFSGCNALSTIIFPPTLFSLPLYGFRNCNTLRSVILPSSCQTLSGYSFYGCSTLASVVFPPNMRRIESNSFKNCCALASVVIPPSITDIGSQVFSDCLRLCLVDLSGYTDPTAIPALSSASAFNNTASHLKFKVANQEMLNAFSAATNWSAFANRFEIA